MPKTDRETVTLGTEIKIPITPRRLPALIKASWAIRKGFKDQDLDAESPEFVMFDEQSSAILERARDLAADEREDQDAVAELQNLAGRHTRSLGLAALGARQWNQHRESSTASLAHRLLQSAITGRPLQPLDERERERLVAFDDFLDLDRDEQWQVLTAREPRLLELEADARAGRFGRLGGVDDTMTTEEKQQVAREGLQGLREIDERLKPLVGRESGSDDVILRSHSARDAAHAALMQLAPSPRDDH